MSIPTPPPMPLPPDQWGANIEARDGDGPRHVFPARPEIVTVTSADIARLDDGPAYTEGYLPEGLALRSTPELLRPELRRRPAWRRAPGQQDDLGEPSTVFAPDDRAVIYDTTYPWCTCGRVATPGGSGSGVMVGPRHMLTASHVVPWLPGGGTDWMTFSPMQYDSSKPFGEHTVTRVYSWQQVNGGDGISSNEAAFDFVVCVLDVNPGTGSMGTRPYSGDWNGQVRWAQVGYPADIGSSLRPVYTTNGVMDSTVSESSGGRTSLRIMHRNDVIPGQSGAPYFGWWTGDSGPSVIAGQSAENWGFLGGPNAASGGGPLPELVRHATTVEP